MNLRVLTLIFVILACFGSVRSQDIINSSHKDVKIRHLSSHEFLLRRELQFDQPFLSAFVISDSINFFMKGYIDGGIYYIDKGPFWGGFSTGFLGLFSYGIPAIGTLIISSTPPRNLGNPNNPNNDLLYLNPKYYDGFQSGAKRKKSSKTWTGFAIGLGSGILTAVLILIVTFTTVYN
ncbi:MAG: hypothetical protein E2O88_11085 [Bacteroidetes bacterium]|nr:MAG: hypothetical protein E2O88_11085 [Bacteroidota bacterium]